MRALHEYHYPKGIPAQTSTLQSYIVQHSFHLYEMMELYPLPRFRTGEWFQSLWECYTYIRSSSLGHVERHNSSENIVHIGSARRVGLREKWLYFSYTQPLQGPAHPPRRDLAPLHVVEIWA